MNPPNPSEMDLLKAGVELLNSLPASPAADHRCRQCDRPSGIYEECDRCFLDRVESDFAELMGEEPAAKQEVVATAAAEPTPEPPVPALAPPPPPEPAPAAAEREPPRDRRWLLIVAVGGCLAVIAAFVLSQVGSDDASTAPANPDGSAALSGLDADPAAAVLGTWSGRIEVRYESGAKDHLNQTINIARLNEGGPAGFSRSSQNGGTCRGPLTFIRAAGTSYRFNYSELNTKECLPTGKITLTPSGDSQMDYREVTKGSVNRGILVR